MGNSPTNQSPSKIKDAPEKGLFKDRKVSGKSKPQEKKAQSTTKYFSQIEYLKEHVDFNLEFSIQSHIYDKYKVAQCYKFVMKIGAQPIGTWVE